MAEVEKALRKQFAKKVKAAELNWNAARPATITPPLLSPKPIRFTVERMDKRPA